MLAVVSAFRRMLARWSLQQETALRRMGEGQTAPDRLSGYWKSERAEAKFFLLALAPFLLIVVSDQLGWPRGPLWHVWLWISFAWALGIVSILFATYWRVGRWYQRRNSKRRDHS